MINEIFMLKIVSIIGARPQFIKAAAVSRAVCIFNKSLYRQDGIKEVIVHTGQHYDKNMSQIFFDELQIPEPDYNLGIGSFAHGRQTGKMLEAIEQTLIKEAPDFVLVYGDTNSTLAGSLAAAKLHIPSAHVEAGLRSFNRKMPEEINRIVADRTSNILFCPTSAAMDNLFSEGIFKNNPSDVQIDIQPFDFNVQLAFQVGDVMYDSILFNEMLSEKKSDTFDRLELKPEKYYLATLHRAENTDNPDNLQNILEAFLKIALTGKKIILPLHPRTKKCIKQLGLSFNSDLMFIKPVGYLDMIQLEKHADAVFTDSGGVQKEAFFLKAPCVTLRNETEWIETVQSGWNLLTGPDTEKIVASERVISGWKRDKAPFTCKSINPTYPYGNGKAAEKIVDILWKIFIKTRQDG